MVLLQVSADGGHEEEGRGGPATQGTPPHSYIIIINNEDFSSSNTKQKICTGTVMFWNL